MSSTQAPMSNRKFYALCVALAIVVSFLVVIFSGNPSEAKTEVECVPSDAYTETIEHAAETHVVHHPEVTEVKHHEAVTHTEYHFAKFTRIKIRPEYELPYGDFSDWTKWTPETHTSWQLDTDSLGEPAFHGQGTYDDGSQWYREWQAQYDGTTRVVEDKAAYDETVVVTEAYDETVIDKDAYTETIEHPAITCVGEKPAPVVSSTSSSYQACGDDFVTVITTTTTVDWILVDGVWIAEDNIPAGSPGAPANNPTVVETTETFPATPYACPNPGNGAPTPGDNAPAPDKDTHNTPAGLSDVPLVISAGL